MLWVNIRQGKGGDCRHIVFAFSRRKLFLPSHLFLTEATAITTCHPFDSFCHQLAAKSASPQTKMKQFICPINHYLALVSSLFIHTITSSQEKTDACNAAGSSLVLSDLQAPGSGAGGPCGWGINPVSPYREVCLVNFYPLLQKIYKASTISLMRHTKPFPSFPHDRMLNETLHVTGAVCYHSVCLRLQTGHYPAIILPDLQSPVEDTIAVSCSPLGGMDWTQLENLHLHDPTEQLIRSGYLFST